MIREPQDVAPQEPHPPRVPRALGLPLAVARQIQDSSRHLLLARRRRLQLGDLRHLFHHSDGQDWLTKLRDFPGAAVLGSTRVFNQI